MAPQVLIIMGSKSDLGVGQKALDTLRKLGISCEIKVASAHRTPKLVADLVENSDAKVFIAIAGLAAALPGAIAAHTIRPVIGVPVSGKVNLDSILSIVQMPPGIPVAAVGLDRGENAGLLAAQIIAITDTEIEKKLLEHRKEQENKVHTDSSSLGAM
ncbi:MAG: 5-(carboxyamino)imidazole ribonucleotide mutase [Candidatus Thermoplasmatota archaeon]|nr:5-(carboxyamino)imidazole ribonucleotide mutase [Euryarchaeota archaeon]MBU4032983.1 5-(carboxyamino)imidazole ribonucleotide mutase [Candidatus Thermoplasmatota archaeon]MBU4143593.1 5-(carboxyamino)imidazole ribonucleotide mutase [Candidatus Thermoplasmatota archaeon]MBU4591354.1 5-(carboxyamino)imidazole ribonucleotide mutase [Candidatus Thermoplasmatota archaeon]